MQDIRTKIRNSRRVIKPEQALIKLQLKVKAYLDKADKPVSLAEELKAMRRTELRSFNRR